MLYLITPDNSIITVINKDIMKKVILTHQMNPDLVLDADADENGNYPVFRSVVVGVCDEIGFESVITKAGVTREQLKIVPYTQSLLGQLVTDYYNLLIQDHGLETMNQALADAVKEGKVEDISIDIDMICDIFDIDLKEPTSIHTKDSDGSETAEGDGDISITPEEMERIAAEYGTPSNTERTYVGLGNSSSEPETKNITPAPGQSLSEVTSTELGVGKVDYENLSEEAFKKNMGDLTLISEKHKLPIAFDHNGMAYILDDIVWEAAKAMAPDGVDAEKFADELVAKCEQIAKEPTPDVTTDDDDLYAAMGNLD